MTMARTLTLKFQLQKTSLLTLLANSTKKQSTFVRIFWNEMGLLEKTCLHSYLLADQPIHQ